MFENKYLQINIWKSWENFFQNERTIITCFVRIKLFLIESHNCWDVNCCSIFFLFQDVYTSVNRKFNELQLTPLKSSNDFRINALDRSARCTHKHILYLAHNAHSHTHTCKYKKRSYVDLIETWADPGNRMFLFPYVDFSVFPIKKCIVA